MKRKPSRQQHYLDGLTIPAEYVLLKHYLGEGDELGIESKIAGYLHRTQRAGGGWPLVYNGVFDLSASVKAYFALKMIGDRPDAEHMQRACQAILDHGGAARTNVFTRVLLALYGILGWAPVWSCRRGSARRDAPP